MGTQSRFLSQCRTSIRPSEYRGGLAVSALPRLQQLEVMSRGISRSDADPRTLCQGSFRGPTECTVASVFQLEAGPHGARLGCAYTGLVEREELCFPPFCLIIRSLDNSKLRELGGELVLVSPVWPTQAWYPSLLDLSVSLPVLLPTSQLGPQGQIHPLIANQTLFLAAWHVSNNSCERKAFVQALPDSSWELGGQAQTQFITPPGRNGIAGVSHGKVIHFAPLWQI